MGPQLLLAGRCCVFLSVCWTLTPVMLTQRCYRHLDVFPLSCDFPGLRSTLDALGATAGGSGLFGWLEMVENKT